MALHSKTEILGPKKTKEIYDPTWIEFKKLTNLSDVPNEDNFMTYFDYLHLYAPFSLWSMYSRLNSTRTISSLEKNCNKFFQD